MPSGCLGRYIAEFHDKHEDAFGRCFVNLGAGPSRHQRSILLGQVLGVPFTAVDALDHELESLPVLGEKALKVIRQEKSDRTEPPI